MANTDRMEVSIKVKLDPEPAIEQAKNMIKSLENLVAALEAGQEISVPEDEDFDLKERPKQHDLRKGGY